MRSAGLVRVCGAAAALCLTLGQAATGLGAAAAAAPCAGGTVSDAGRGWLALSPAFPAGPADVLDLAAPVFAPDLLYASNGRWLMRSQDSGCTWTPVLDAAASEDAAGGPATITSLAAPSAATSSEHVYVGLSGAEPVLGLPRVAASADRGATWRISGLDSGLPPAGRLDQLTAHPLNPQAVLAAVALPAVGPVLYGSGDGGRSWARRTGAAGRAPGDLLRADPLIRTAAFALGAGSLVRSVDGGRTFTAAGPQDVRLAAYDVAVGGGGIRLAGVQAGAPVIERSDDAGATWRRKAAPVVASSVAAAPLQELVALSDHRRLLLDIPREPALDVGPPDGAPSALVVSAPTAAGFHVSGLRRGQVLRATFALGAGLPTLRPPPLVGGLPAPITLLPGGRVGQFPATLVPGSTQVVLPAGGSQRIPYSLLLPRTPTPLDVMFLVDTTGSMGGVIAGLRQDLAGIVNALNTAGLDARFGIGDFKDYPRPDGGGSPGDYPYRLGRRIGPADEALREAIAGLEAGGGGDGPESALTALMQSTTGAGDTFEGRTYVRPGMQARYRAAALRLAVVATDVRFQRGGEPQPGQAREAPYPGPTFAQTEAALVRAGVRQVGLDAGGGGRSDLETMAAATGAAAPAGGVDCDGNGTAEVAEGAPLVCALDGAVVQANSGGSDSTSVAVAQAVVGLADSLEDRQDVVLSLQGDPARARLVGSTVREGVNIKADNELDYLLELSCPRDRKPSTHRLALAAAAGGRPVAGADVQLSCEALPAAPAAPVVLPPGAPQRAAAEPPAAPQPPAQPVPNPNPNPNANVNANPLPNPNVNPQLGVAERTEQQVQVALAQEDLAQSPQSYAMSRRPVQPAEAVLLCGGLMASVAAGAVWQLRRREQYAPSAR